MVDLVTKKQKKLNQIRLDNEWKNNYQTRINNLHQMFHGDPLNYEKISTSASFNRLLGVKHHEIPIPEKFEAPVVSVICPTIRIGLILNFYRSLLSNNTPFEVIFIGPEEPNFPLPANCRYIAATVRLAQSYFIGINNARGKYVVAMCDDFFVSDHFLDKMISTNSEMCTSKGQRIWWTSTLDFERIDYREMVWMCDKKVVMDLSLNRKNRYKWNHDLEVRFLRIGGKITSCHDTVVWEIMHFVDMPRLIESIKRMYGDIACHSEIIPAIDRMYSDIIFCADIYKSLDQVPSMLKIRNFVLTVLGSAHGHIPDIVNVAEPIISDLSKKRTVKFNVRYRGKESRYKKFVPYEYTDDVCTVNQW